MSEILCPLCNAQSPENALYCQQCGQPIRCKECGTELLPTAQACIRCGKLIPERSTNGQFQIGMNTVPPGYNRLKLHETPDVRDVDLIVHNDAIEHIRDFFPPLVGNRPSGRRNNPIDQQVEQQTDVVEVPSALLAPQPQLAPTSSQSTVSQEGIWQIFRDRDGRLTQERRELKATNKRDYIIRLAYLYMFARYRIGDEKVPREDVFKILDEASVKDTHRSTYINESGIRTDENDDLWLTLDGRERAQQYIADALDPKLPEGWPKGAESHPPSNRAKKLTKKGSEQRSSSDIEVAGWVSHEKTKELARTALHSTLDTLTVQDRALFALYCLDMIGVTAEVQLTQISRYLFDAFQVQVAPTSLPKALTKAVENKPAYATYRRGSGYRITSSGKEYVEKQLKNKQTEFATPKTAEVSGATLS